MPQQFAEFLQAGNRSPGVLMIPQNLPTADPIEALVLIRKAEGSYGAFVTISTAFSFSAALNNASMSSSLTVP